MLNVDNEICEEISDRRGRSSGIQSVILVVHTYSDKSQVLTAVVPPPPPTLSSSFLAVVVCLSCLLSVHTASFSFFFASSLFVSTSKSWYASFPLMYAGELTSLLQGTNTLLAWLVGPPSLVFSIVIFVTATDKVSQSGANKRFLYSVSEMQGWRISE
jgi:hypothetical protein